MPARPRGSGRWWPALAALLGAAATPAAGRDKDLLRLDFSLGVWMVHAGMVLLLVVLFAQRMQLIRLRLGK